MLAHHFKKGVRLSMGDLAVLAERGSGQRSSQLDKVPFPESLVELS